MAKTKKDFDKELMYQKIMPSAFKAKPETTSEAEPLSVTNCSPVPSPLTKPAKERPIVEPTKDIQFDNTNQAALSNITEILVLKKINEVFGRMDCCKCDRCKKDVAAIALNKLQPKYVVTDSSQLKEILATQSTQEITTALLQAVLQVRKNPRH